MSARSVKLRSPGWTEEGMRLLMSARAYGLCADCGKALKSKFLVGDVRRRRFCTGRECSDLFYESFYQSWAVTKRAVLRRVRNANQGAIRCESCGREPIPVRKSYGNSKHPEWTFETHRGYEFDHTVEIAAGGNPFDVNNVRLLCLRCHRRKTARFLKRKTPSARPETLKPLEAFA